MSYDISLVKNGKSVKVRNHTEGGIYRLVGCDEAELNITYNYAWFFYNFLDKKKGLRWLYGKTGKQCMKRLKFAIKKLGKDRHSDYWADTPGNAGYALLILLQWAKKHPTAIFEGD